MRKSAIVVGLIVVLLVSTMPTNCFSSNQQKDNVASLDQTNENLPKVDEMTKSQSFEELVSFNNISTISTLDSVPISRSMIESRREISLVDQTAQPAPDPVFTPAPEATPAVKAAVSPVQESAPPTTVNKPVDGPSIIRYVASSNGCTQTETDLLLKIAESESHFNIDAVNSGSDCVGLFQLDSNKGSYAQRVDPYWNTTRAIEYMKARYGSISAAYNFRVSHNWY